MQASDLPTIKLNAFLGKRLPIILLIVGAGALAGLVGLGFFDKRQAYFAYLFALTFCLSLSLGSLFFVLLAWLSKAGWSVILRRVPEALTGNFILLAVLFIPILFGLQNLYPWANHDLLKDNHAMTHRAGWLNPTFFAIRLAFYFSLWVGLSIFFRVQSKKQDNSTDVAPTLLLQRRAGIAIVLYGLTQTFAAFDILMSLHPVWYSTIFGVYFAAGSFSGAIALITVLVHLLNRDGLLKGHVTTAHFYDLGKMLYVFNLFWAYIAFLQYLLVWYANLPEETSFYHIRSAHGWSGMVLVLIFGHALIPALFFMSRHAKMNLRVNLFMSFWILLMHGVDIYFIVLPNFHPTFTYFRPAEALALIGVGSIYMGWFLLNLGRAPLIPSGDPRLNESLAHGRHL